MDVALNHARTCFGGLTTPSVSYQASPQLDWGYGVNKLRHQCYNESRHFIGAVSKPPFFVLNRHGYRSRITD